MKRGPLCALLLACTLHAAFAAAQVSRPPQPPATPLPNPPAAERYVLTLRAPVCDSKINPARPCPPGTIAIPGATAGDIAARGQSPG